MAKLMAFLLSIVYFFGSFGIGIAILANGNPIGCIFASILFGFLNVMGTTMGRLPGLSIPASIIDLIEGIVMVCVIVSYYVRSRAEFRAQKTPSTFPPCRMTTPFVRPQPNIRYSAELLPTEREY